MKNPSRTTSAKSAKSASKSSRPKSAMASSVRELARMLNAGKSSAARWPKRDDWPFSKKPPWDPVAVGIWVRDNLGANPAEIRRRADADEREAEALALDDTAPGDDPLARRSLGEGGSDPSDELPPPDGEPATLQGVMRLLVIERRKNLELKRMLDSDKLHSVAECREQRLRQIRIVRNELTDLGRSLALLLVGKSRDDIQALIDEQTDAICNRFAGKKE